MTLFGADGVVDAARRARFASWLAPLLGRRVEADSLHERRPTGGGWSNDTVIIDIAGDVAVVLRMEPDGPAMFPDYDLTREHRVLSWLSTRPSLPTPPLVGADLDGTLFGRPLIAMKFVAGHTPADDRPSFAEAGWLHDAPPTTQRRFHDQLIDVIAALHQLPVEPFADALGERVPRSLVPSLDALERVWHWNRGERWPVVIDSAFTRLRSSMPSIDVTCPLWGDARPANVIVADDFSTPKALLDWELASVGPPELDVLWLLEMNRMRTVGAGVQPLPGFPDDSASILHYEHISHRTLRDLQWYRAFSALKIAVLMHRFLRVSVLRGKLDARHRVLGDTVASRRVAQLLQVS